MKIRAEIVAVDAGAAVTANAGVAGCRRQLLPLAVLTLEPQLPEFGVRVVRPRQARSLVQPA